MMSTAARMASAGEHARRHPGGAHDVGGPHRPAGLGARVAASPGGARAEQAGRASMASPAATRKARVVAPSSDPSGPAPALSTSPPSAGPISWPRRRRGRHQPEVAVVLAVLGLLGDQALSGQDQGQVAEAEQGAPEASSAREPARPSSRKEAARSATPAASMPTGRWRSAHPAQRHGHHQRDHGEGGGDQPDHALVGPQGQGPVGGDRAGQEGRRLGEHQRDQDPAQPPRHRPPRRTARCHLRGQRRPPRCRLRRCTDRRPARTARRRRRRARRPRLRRPCRSCGGWSRAP